MTMNMSNRDKKLLVYLIAVGLLAVVYFFVAKPKMDENEQLQTEIESLKTQVNYYNEIYINRAEYEDKIAKAQVEYNESLNKFFGGLNQENTLMNVKGIEDATNTWISRVSFQEAQTMIGGGSGEVIPEDGSEQSTENSDASVASGSLTGLKQDLNIDFSCKYADFKRFIEYMQNYDQRLFVTSISATYSVDSDLVTGSIVLSQYAVTGAGKEYSAPDLSNIQTGVDNIFTTLREPTEELFEDGTISEVIEPSENDMTGEVENPDGTDSENEDNGSDGESNEEDESSDSQEPAEEAPADKPKPKTGGVI